jgi:hypothetical protein
VIFSRAARRAVVILAACASGLTAAEPAKDGGAAKDVTKPLRFAVIGDSGSGEESQFKVAEQLAIAHKHWSFDFVLMLGDNIYGAEAPHEYAARFEKPYRALLEAGLPFYAALGNHDHPNQRFYKLFNMEGRRYYTFESKDESARFFAVDSNYLDPEQLAWLKKEACGADARWKLAFFHHPIYSSGAKHGSSLELRRILEPVFRECGIDVVFSGHDHFYERIKPQHDILYFVSGGAGKLRPGDIEAKTGLTDAGFDRGYHFMVVEIIDDNMRFSVLSERGKVVDEGEWPGREGREAQAEAADELKEKAKAGSETEGTP